MATSWTPVSSDDVLRDTQNFSLVLGGPLYQLLRRARLADDALLGVRQRMIVISLVAWLPLLLLSALEGKLLGGGVAVPFLLDTEVHTTALPSLWSAVHEPRRGQARVPGDGAPGTT